MMNWLRAFLNVAGVIGFLFSAYLFTTAGWCEGDDTSHNTPPNDGFVTFSFTYFRQGSLTDTLDAIGSYGWDPVKTAFELGKVKMEPTTSSTIHYMQAVDPTITALYQYMREKGYSEGMEEWSQRRFLHAVVYFLNSDALGASLRTVFAENKPTASFVAVQTIEQVTLPSQWNFVKKYVAIHELGHIVTEGNLDCHAEPSLHEYSDGCIMTYLQWDVIQGMWIYKCGSTTWPNGTAFCSKCVERMKSKHKEIADVYQQHGG